MDAYSGLKAAWHIDRIRDLRAGKRIAPVHLQLIISDFCNQNCHFCAYRMDGGFTSRHFGGNPTRFIPTEKAIEILNDAKEAGVQSVQFTGGGEPTVHKDHERIFQQAWDLGFKTGLVTNGTNLKAWPFDWIRVSLDAGTEKTYAKVRESKLWPKVMRNLKLGHSGLYGIGFVVTRENCTEILEAAEIAFAAGADYIRVTAMFSEQGSEHYRGKMKTIQRGIAAAKELENANFKVVDLFHHRLDDLDSGTPTVSRCGYQQFTTYIGGDQHVYRCCSTAYTPLGDVGDLSNMRFSEWLSHDPYTDFDPGQCRVCQFNQQNEVIEYMVGTPMHVEFP